MSQVNLAELLPDAQDKLCTFMANNVCVLFKMFTYLWLETREIYSYGWVRL